MLLPENGPPITPGEILLEEFLKPMGLTQSDFAKHLGWTYARVNEIANGKRGISPSTALTFADVFNTSPDLWLNAQLACDLWEAQQKHTPAKRLESA